MQFLIRYSRMSFFFLLAIILFSSCEKEIPETDDVLARKAITPMISSLNCLLDGDDLQVADIEWSDDCSEATVTLSMCCDCPSAPGQKKGCIISPAEVFLQIERSPFNFVPFYHDIPPTALHNGSCYEMSFVVCNNPSVSYISQLRYNDEGVDYDTNGLDVECP